MKHVVRQSSNRVLELDAVPYRSSGAESATNPGRHLELRFLVLKCSGASFKDLRNSLGNAAMQGVERCLETSIYQYINQYIYCNSRLTRPFGWLSSVAKIAVWLALDGCQVLHQVIFSSKFSSLCNCHVLASTNIIINYAYEILSSIVHILTQIQLLNLKLCGRLCVALTFGDRATIVVANEFYFNPFSRFAIVTF